MSRISTGSGMLDSVLEGGFPVSSLIAVTGPPGSGKTIFAANWIYNCVEKLGGNGLYVSFVEGRKSFIENMRRLGLDFERLEQEGRFKFLDMVTLREVGVPVIFEQIIHEILDMKATALVIDSFSAVSQVIEKPHDTRILVHAVLGRMVREMGCTTIIIIEKMNSEEIYEPVEFLADCIIHFNKTEVDGSLLRYLKLIKARGTEIQRSHLVFTLKGGFKVFRPLLMGGLPEPQKRFKIIPHSKDYYSSGIRDLDRIIGPIFRRGSYNLLEFEKGVTLTPERMFRATVSNALNQGGCAVILPPQGLSAQTVWDSLKPFVPENTLKRNLKIVDFKATINEVVEPYVILFEGKSLRDDMIILWDNILELRRQTGRPILSIVGFDTLEYVYGKDETLRILGDDLAKTRNFRDVRLNIIRPECALTKHLSALADLHLAVREIYGILFLQGIKPRTPLLNIELHTDEEGTEIKLTPVL